MKAFPILQKCLQEAPVNQIVTNTCLSELCSEFSRLFEPGLGKILNYKAHIYIKPGARFRYFKPRPVAFATRTKIEADLDRLLKLGVIEPVETAEVGARPIVPVAKFNGTVRICGDFKVTVKAYTDMQRYPLPHPEELRAALSGGKIFSKVDLASAYLQMEVDEESRKYLVVSTHKGHYRYTRLPFGFHGAPAIFQSAIDAILNGLPGVVAYLDDIFVTGFTEQEHIDRLRALFTRLQNSGIRFKKEKYSFCLQQPCYLGHIIDASATLPDPEKVRAIVKCPVATNSDQLRSFLGMTNYYGKFIANMSCVAAPFYSLTRKDTSYVWGPKQQSPFENLKSALASDVVLAHYDPAKEICVAADASAYGVGAVLCHRECGIEHPVSYVSRVLSDSERNYSQIEKERLAKIFVMQRFQRYISGRHFTLLTDHRPLLKIFGEHESVLSTTSARLQRWAIFLGSFDYSINLKQSGDQSNADSLSRHFVDKPELIDFEICQIQHERLESLPVDWKMIRDRSRVDPVISQAIRYTRIGWPETCPSDDMRPFWERRTELTIQDDCLLWGIRVVIPERHRNALLISLHEAHPGLVKMKVLARLHLWWPGLDSAIENTVRKCDSCQQTAHNQ